MDRLLSATYGVFSNSGLRREGLEKVHDELDATFAEGTAVKKKKKLKSAKRHIKVRRLSRAASIDSIVDPLDALIAYLHELKASKSKRKADEEEAPDEDDEAEIAESGRMSLGELIGAYSDFEVVAMPHFLGDVCEQLAAPSASLQGSKLDVHTAHGPEQHRRACGWPSSSYPSRGRCAGARA